jgi:hypothetical protein
MRLFDTLYKLKINDDIGDPDTLGVRFESVDSRLDALEGLRTDWNAAIAAITQEGLDRISMVLEPATEKLLGQLNVGIFLQAHSPTEAIVATGRVSLYVEEDERGQFAPAAYVNVMPAGATSPAMMGAVISYDRTSGELVVNVDQVAGAGVAGNWLISPTSPIDNAAIAAGASASATAAASSAAAATSSRDIATTQATSAATSAAAAAMSATSALGAEAATIAAREATLAAATAYNQLWLGAHASDPLLDNQGNALTPGASYVNTSAGELKFYLEAGWTTMVVPIGSEVLSIFGRTGTVTASSGDYNSGQVSRSAVGGVGGTTVEASLIDLKGQIDLKLAASAVSSYGGTLIDDADAATARGTLGLGDVATHAASDFAAAVHHHAWADITSGLPATLAGYGIGDAYTKAAVDAAIAAVVGGAPGSLSTLKELADAIGDDPAFITTMLTAIGTKLSSSAVSAFAMTILDDTTAAGARSTLGAAATAHTHAIADVTGLQSALDAKLASTPAVAAMAGLTMAVDQAIYFTGPSTAAAHPLTSFARSLLDDADAATARGTLGVRIGTDVQAQDATLTAIAALGTGANKIAYTTGVDTWAEAALSAFGRSLIAAADAAGAYAVLGQQFPTGTQIVFGAAPPTGWAARGDLNDRGLRISSTTVGAAGGIVGFSSVFSRVSTDIAALSVANLPPHEHGPGGLATWMNHTGAVVGFPGGSADALLQSGGTGFNKAVTGGATASVGSGVGHAHTMDIRLAYYDVSIGVKS